MPGTPPFADGIDPATAHVLAAKTGAERLAIAAAMYRSARRMLSHHLRCEHPEWSPEQVATETARRLAHGAG